MIGFKLEEKKAKAYAKGVFSYIINLTMVFWIVVLLLTGVHNIFGLGLDPTDKDGWNRSGLAYYVDHETGVEYVGTPYGGIMVREKSCEH